jgi:hypothetical protein
MAERHAQHRKAVLEQLRREAGPVDSQGRWDVPKDTRERFDGDRPDRDD